MATGTRLFGGCRALMAAAKSTGRPAPSPSKLDPKPKGLAKHVPVSPELGKFLGATDNRASRFAAVKKVWEYIKANDLQNPKNKKEIHCDETLKTIFSGKDTVHFLEVAKYLSKHFPKST